MDRLDEYIIAKNTNKPDEFQDHVELTDMTIVRNSALWVILAPLGTFSLLFFLRNARTFVQQNHN